MSSITYRPEIDGLRAVAVIPVISFHLGNDWLPGGFMGVDVFFVISGFLITSVILRDYENDIFTFANFWLRRVRRILPVMITMVIVTLVAGQLLLYGPDIRYLGTQGVASLLSFANISQWIIAGNYWGQDAENSLLLHTWSLSVEEQFYLFFPLLLYFTLKYFTNRVVVVVFTITVLSVVLFFYGTERYSTATFYLLPTRAWELGSGSLLAVLINSGKLKLQSNPIIAAAGLLAVVLSYFLISGESGIPYLLFIPVIGTIFLIGYTGGNKNIISNVLSINAIVYIGRISYSLYIWHWPVLVISRNLSLKLNMEFSAIFAVAIIFILSIASYHLIEVPARRNTKIAPYILAVLLIGVAYSYNISRSDHTEDFSIYNETVWKGKLYNVSPKREWPDFVNKRMEGITVPVDDSINPLAYSEGGILKLYGNKSPEIVVLGDSHALMWSGILDEIAADLGKSISFYAADGTSTFFNIPVEKSQDNLFFNTQEKYEFDQSRLFFLGEWEPKIVIIALKWSSFKNAGEAQDLINFIDKMGSKIIFIEQPPELFFGDKNAPQYLAYLGLKPSAKKKLYIDHNNNSPYQSGKEMIRLLAGSCNQCEFIRIADIFVDNSKVEVINSFDVLYIDDDHLSYVGSLKAKKRILSAIQKAL